VQKFLKEVSLLDQVFVKAADGKQTVAQMLKEKATTVKGFTLYVVGEGIEKKAGRLRCRSGRPGGRRQGRSLSLLGHLRSPRAPFHLDPCHDRPPPPCRRTSASCSSCRARP
jgi:hypothetical protein